MVGSEGGIDYLHSYYSLRPYVDWNTCGQAAVGTLLDYHKLNPYGLEKSVYDARDGRYHWDDGEVVDRIRRDFPPDNLLGLFGTTGGRIRDALVSSGLEARAASSRDTGKGLRI